MGLGQSLRTNQFLDNALTLLRQIIKGYPFSALASRAFLLLARVLIDDGKFGEARLDPITS
jgi:hypothetical protein